MVGGEPRLLDSTCLRVVLFHPVTPIVSEGELDAGTNELLGNKAEMESSYLFADGGGEEPDGASTGDVAEERANRLA